MDQSHRPVAKGRGSAVNPPNRFESLAWEDDFEQLEPDDPLRAGQPALQTQFIPDQSKTILAENDSPDVGFRYTINPYRGCEHGCVYCYARPTHETLGFGAGLDFETKILVKHRAPELLREALARDSWHGEPIALSGVTDCYQPAERRYGLTRRCLEVMLEARQSVIVVTKNALVQRDLDLLKALAAERLVHVNLSVTTLDQELARTMEPRTSAPAARLRVIQALAEAAVPVRVMVAPVIPGLTDSEMPAILEAAKQAGAMSAAYILLRLPLAVRAVFLDWLRRCRPLQQPRVESFIRATRSGKLSDSRFGSRMRGDGPVAQQIARTFRVFTRKLGLDRRLPPLDTSRFRPPRPLSGQLRLF